MNPVPASPNNTVLPVVRYKLAPTKSDLAIPMPPAVTMDPVVADVPSTVDSCEMVPFVLNVVLPYTVKGLVTPVPAVLQYKLPPVPVASNINCSVLADVSGAFNVNKANRLT